MGPRQTIRFCTAHDGARIAYAQTGSGPPLVKVGNWLSHLEFELTSPVWSHMVESLSRDYSVLRYDQRGSGLSDWDIASISFDDWVRDLEAVVDAAGVDRFALLGISQGCPVGIAYAARYPERVTHLILHGGYARGWLKRDGGQAAVDLAETVVRFAELGWGKNDASYRQFFTSKFIPEGSLEQQRWFNELQRVSASAENAARTMRAWYGVEVTALLPEITCPTIVLHATGDLSVPFAEGRLLAGGIAQSRFVPLDTPHHLMLEHDPAWVRWTTEVRDFLGTRSSSPIDPRFETLTPRERELVELIAQGRDNAQIAATLTLSDKTVRNHITSIFSKLEVENRSRAIVLARTAGFGTQS